MHRVLFGFLGILVLARVGFAQEWTPCTNPDDAATAEAVATAQMEAFNDHDVERYLSHFAPDVQVFRFPETPLSSGREALRPLYANGFTTYPTIHAALTNRIVQSNFVIDYERVTGYGEEEQSQIAMFEVCGGMITTYWTLS